VDATPQPRPLTARRAVEQAAIHLLLPEPEALPWLFNALERVAVLTAALWIDQQNAPSRSELRTMLDPRHLDMEALERRLSASPIIAGTLLQQLPDGAEAVRASLAGRGQSDLFDRLACPSPKLMVACAVTALHQQMRGTLLNAKNTRQLTLCVALLWRAREHAEDPAAAPDVRVSQWAGALAAARRIYAAGVAPADEYGAEGLAHWAVGVALRRQPDGGKE
jgi:hypothetical protein